MLLETIQYEVEANLNETTVHLVAYPANIAIQSTPENHAPGSSALIFSLLQQFSVSCTVMDLPPPIAVVRPLSKGPLLSFPNAFTGFHIAQNLHNTVKMSQVEWELQTKFMREALLLSHRDSLAF